MSIELNSVRKLTTDTVHLFNQHGRGFSTLCGLYLGEPLHGKPKYEFGNEELTSTEALSQVTCMSCHRNLIAFLTQGGE